MRIYDGNSSRPQSGGAVVEYAPPAHRLVYPRDPYPTTALMTTALMTSALMTSSLMTSSLMTTAQVNLPVLNRSGDALRFHLSISTYQRCISFRNLAPLSSEERPCGF
ncbi:MAG: hypothetical protein O2931_04685 [Planctomycetota bacterium]|nr:hypothetical protein [Planctomycetota bacterium]